MFADYTRQVVTPKSRICFGQSIKSVGGDVKHAENLLKDDGTAASLYYPNGGTEPVLILDMGPAAPGGYPVFKVKSANENAVLRIAYSDDYRFTGDNAGGRNGDFSRGSCKYLGVELPVLPANPGRFELYTVSEGEYLSPLIQGQQRFVRISLEHPGSSVEIEYFYIYYTSDMSPIEGGFDCDHEKLAQIWYWSVYTYQLASFTHDAWDTLNGWLFPRALTKGNDAGIIKEFTTAADYTFSFTARISRNPYYVSGIGFTFRAPDQNNGYVARIDLDGGFYVYKRTEEVYNEIKQIFLSPLIDNRDYKISVTARGNHFVITLDGAVVAEFTDNTFKSGSMGFCQMQEKWAMVREVLVEDTGGAALFFDDFSGGLDAYLYTKTPPFVSDGAKRDRLPWSGDLDWAGRNGYYGLRNHTYIKGALELLAFHQNEEGFIFGTCYPENKVKPQSGDYGHYESDIFSAWFVIDVADYLLYTGDCQTTAQLYSAARADLEYLLRFVEADGIFNQRYETSKGLWDHMLGDYGRNGYNNIIVYDAMCEGAFLAEHLGRPDDAARYKDAAARIKSGIQSRLIDEGGALVKSEENRAFCYMSNSYAMAIGFFEPETAKEVMMRICTTPSEHGKVITTNIRGAYQYGFEREGFSQLTKGHPFNTDWGFSCNIGWLDMLDDDDVPHTTYECMHYPTHFDPGGGNWGDKSHPDTGVAHILSGCILGIMPCSPGYKEFLVRPRMYGLGRAAGIVPTPDGGSIEISVQNGEDVFAVDVHTDCSGCTGTLMIPMKKAGSMTKDGHPIAYKVSEGYAVLALDGQTKGRYESR